LKKHKYAFSELITPISNNQPPFPKPLKAMQAKNSICWQLLNIFHREKNHKKSVFVHNSLAGKL
jgi:hypothetical protein